MSDKSDTKNTTTADTGGRNGQQEDTTDPSQRASRASVTINTEDDEGETGKRTVNIDELGHDYDASNDLGDSWRLIYTSDNELEPHPPPTWGHADLASGRDAALGRTSSHCEACGREVDGWNGETHRPLKMYPNDYRHENVVILCRDCYDFTPNWREVVMDRRPDRSASERAIDWLRNPHARLLFWRRVGVGLGAAILVGTFLLIIATLGAMVLGSGNGVVEIGISVSTVTTLWTVFAPAWGWIALGSVALGLAAYWLHTHERQRMDALGTQAFDAELTDPPWRSLWIGGGVLAVCATVAIAGPRTNTLATLTVALAYLFGIVPTGIVTERVVRADRCHPRLDWTPRYDRELFVLRASVVIGAVMMVGYVFGPSVPPLTVVGGGLFVPVVAIAGYLYYRTIYDLGSDWRVF